MEGSALQGSAGFSLRAQGGSVVRRDVAVVNKDSERQPASNMAEVRQNTPEPQQGDSQEVERAIPSGSLQQAAHRMQALLRSIFVSNDSGRND